MTWKNDLLYTTTSEKSKIKHNTDPTYGFMIFHGKREINQFTLIV